MPEAGGTKLKKPRSSGRTSAKCASCGYVFSLTLPERCPYCDSPEKNLVAESNGQISISESAEAVTIRKFFWVNKWYFGPWLFGPFVPVAISLYAGWSGFFFRLAFWALSTALGVFTFQSVERYERTKS